MFFSAFLLFVLLAPLYKGGNRPWPLLLLELAAITFLLTLALRHRRFVAATLPGTLALALALLLGYPLVQLLPLPDALWRALPGHQMYVDLLARFAPDAVVATHTISLVPSATEYGWLAMLPPLACLLVARMLAPVQVERLLMAMSVLAGAAGLLGLLQVGSGGSSFFYLSETQVAGFATGTFVNRDHFAAMLAMVLPVIVGLLLVEARRARHAAPARGGAQANLLALRVLLFVTAVLVLLCLIFTFSRVGIATALVGLAFSSTLLTRARNNVRHAKLIVGTLIVAGVVLAVLIGIAPLMEKLDPAQLRLSADGRFAIYAATLRAAAEFLPFGSGLSTFASVFPRFQEGVFGGYIDYAHNDYLQFYLEVGLVAPVVVALLLAAYATRMWQLLHSPSRRSFVLLQIAAGVGMLPLILHSLFDFALHMPANAMWFATLAGVTLHPGAREQPRVIDPVPARASPDRGIGS